MFVMYGVSSVGCKRYNYSGKQLKAAANLRSIRSHETFGCFVKKIDYMEP